MNALYLLSEIVILQIGKTIFRHFVFKMKDFFFILPFPQGVARSMKRTGRERTKHPKIVRVIKTVLRFTTVQN